MKLLLKLVTKGLERKCRDWETSIKADHQVPGDVEEFLDTPFQGIGGNSLAVDIFRPKDQNQAPLPVIIMIHGGGLVVGDRKLSQIYCENLAKKGFLVFAPEYRLATETNAISEIGDVHSAFSFVSEHLSEYGGDPEHVSVMSESAGSYLAVYTVAAVNSQVLRDTFGFNELPLRIRTLACFSGMFYTTRWDALRLVYAGALYEKRKRDKSFMQLMNPENPEVMGHLPPVFLVSSDADFLKRYSQRYAKALQEAKHPCEILYYDKNKELDHAFPSLKPDLPESRDIMDKLIEWIGKMERTQ